MPLEVHFATVHIFGGRMRRDHGAVELAPKVGMHACLPMYRFSNSPVKCLLTNVVLPTLPSPTSSNLNVGTSIAMTPVLQFAQLVNLRHVSESGDFWDFLETS